MGADFVISSVAQRMILLYIIYNPGQYGNVFLISPLPNDGGSDLTQVTMVGVTSLESARPVLRFQRERFTPIW